ncbi:motility-associated protein [Desulfurella sp.]|uniref:motility-associated protein n=1 Tax=Desulfurella sp. TaxID=1962857 RepID=UPI003D11151E
MNVIGVVLTIAAILTGFVLGGGKPLVLIQVSEYIVLFGGAAGILVASTTPSIMKDAIKVIVGFAKSNPLNKKVYLELLLFIYNLSVKVRKDGILSLEVIVDTPEESPIMQSNTFLLKNKGAKEFVIDAIRNIVTGIEIEKLDEMLDSNIEVVEKEMSIAPKMVAKIAESMPGMGIVAAVMGVILTMGALGGSILEVGHHVAGALTGTFLGLLLCYVVIGPMATVQEIKNEEFTSYLKSLKIGIISIAKGDAPIIAMESVRQTIAPAYRTEFDEVEKLAKERR